MPGSPPVAAASVLLAAVAGGLVGAVTCRWLAWLRRGAGVPPYWCVLGVGALWAGVAAGRASGVVAAAVVPLLLGLCWLVVAGSAVDVAVHRLPDALTLPAAPAALASLVPLGWPAVLRGALAGLVLCAAHGLVRLVVPAAMGGGDVKLAAPVGVVLGGASWGAVVIWAVLAAVLTASAPALLSIAASRWTAGRRAWGRRPGGAARDGPRRSAGPVTRSVPHGPSMLVSCLAVVVTAAVTR